MAGLGDVDAFGSDFKTHGNMQVICEGGLLVGFAIVIGVFEDDELVAWLGISNAVVRVAWHGGNPETSLIIECHLHWVGEVGEFFFGSKEFHFVSIGSSNFGLRGWACLILEFAAFTTGLVVGYNWREFECFGICSSEVHFLALECLPDCLVPQCGHLAGLFIFVAVVLWWSVFAAASVSVNLHTVGHFVIVEPAPVFLVYCSMG